MEQESYSETNSCSASQDVPEGVEVWLHHTLLVWTSHEINGILSKY
jgi:hypothetical protein